MTARNAAAVNPTISDQSAVNQAAWCARAAAKPAAVLCSAPFGSISAWPTMPEMASAPAPDAILSRAVEKFISFLSRVLLWPVAGWREER